MPEKIFTKPITRLYQASDTKNSPINRNHTSNINIVDKLKKDHAKTRYYKKTYPKSKINKYLSIIEVFSSEIIRFLGTNDYDIAPKCRILVDQKHQRYYCQY